MPTIGTFHTQYWEFSDTLVAPVVISHGGYPAWQASVITPSLFGIIGAWLDTKVAQFKWWKALYRRIHGYTPAQRSALLRTMDLIEHPAYPAAQAAVRTCATTLGFNKPNAWVALSHSLKEKSGWAENSWRHLLACSHLEKTAPSTMTNPELNGLIELAYQEFAARGR